MIRWLAYGVAGLVMFLSGIASAAFEAETDSWLVVGAVPIALLASLPRRQLRSLALAIGAGIVAAWTPDAVFLWPAVAALVFIAVAEDLQEPPWLGWAGGLVGSGFSMLMFTYNWSIAPFLATFLGGGLGLLLRTWVRSTELEGVAEELRGQAMWLEQRTSVARELHDVVGHHVTAMVVQAEAGQLGDPTQALRTIGDLGRDALKELDSLVVHLRDPDAPLTVTAPPRLLDIDELLAAPLRRSGVQVEVELADDLELDELDVLTVYRVAQEALTNIVRHAGARHAWVELARHDDRVRLRVSDDGTGPPDQATRGSGLLGIKERVAARGGTVELVRRPGGGSILDMSLPLVTG